MPNENSNKQLTDISNFLEEAKELRTYELSMSNFGINNNSGSRSNNAILKRAVEMNRNYSGKLGEPEQAYLSAILNHFGLEEEDLKALEENRPIDWAAKMNLTKSQLETLDTQVKDLDVSVRAVNGLDMYREKNPSWTSYTGNIKGIYMGEIVQISKWDVVNVIRGFGRKSFSEFDQIAKKAGLSMGMNINYVRPEERAQSER